MKTKLITSRSLEFVLVGLVAIGIASLAATAAKGEDAQATGTTARAVCFQVSGHPITAFVPQSPTDKERDFDFTVTTTIQSDGRIDVSLSNLEHRPDHPKLDWLFKNLRLSATVSDLDVRQTATPAGDVQSTQLFYRLDVQLQGEANLVADAELVPGHKGTVYGPAVDGKGKLSLAEDFRSDLWPLLNTVNKDQFRIGKVEGVSFEGYTLQGGDVPNRTHLVSLEGIVRIKRLTGGWVKPVANMDLGIGDMVKTLSNGKAEIQLASTAVIKLEPNSEFYIPEEENTREKVGFIKMMKGVLWANARRDNDSLKVATPSAICGLRGTEFEIVVDDQQSCFHCITGELLVKPTTRARDVTELVVKAGERKCVLSDPADSKKPDFPVTVRVTEKSRGKELPVAGALVTLRQKGKAPQAGEAFTDEQGVARLFAEKEDIYQIEAAAENYLSQQIASATVRAGRPARFDILLRRPGETPTTDPSETPVAKCNFAGTWKVLWYNNVEGTGKPTGEQKLTIVVKDGKAIGYSDMWAEKVEEFCSGPLSGNGQVWNATRYANGELQLRFYDIHFDPDCDRFVGKWSGDVPEGYEPHNYAWIGTRTSGDAEPPVEGPPVEGPPADGAKHTVELSSRTRTQTLAVAPGAEITVKVATSAGTGYQMEMAPLATRALAVSGPSDEAMRRPGGTGRPLLGAGPWKVYQVKVAPEATGDQVLKFNFFRTQGKVDIEYVLTVRIQK